MSQFKPYKKTFDYSYTLGTSPTIELLEASPAIAKAVFVAPNSGHSQGIQKIRTLSAAHSIPCSEDEKTIRRLARNENCFAIGVFKKVLSKLAADKPHVVLVNPDDAGNLGTILRTMLGFNHNDLAIIRPSVDAFDPKTIRASMGAIFKQRIAYYDSLDDYRTDFTHHLYPFVLDTPNLLSGTHFDQPYSLIFGNEGTGLPQTYQHIGTPVRIEQTKHIDSLNLAVSVSLALYKVYTNN